MVGALLLFIYLVMGWTCWLSQTSIRPGDTLRIHREIITLARTCRLETRLNWKIMHPRYQSTWTLVGNKHVMSAALIIQVTRIFPFMSCIAQPGQ
ncbi:hypothetical protein BO86DRAFT_31185 [Aspergillus japonicus CBS 114.51]|uniref:Secreted protein n=1 Tax=Aspergillus japonicus CBS 114.51 TaxID=1448312 RepID=A0A8T8X660_ASPJA|nr:hypothetical protein BO86DRAFT_31185 [Aspergillus japonicus CBS 114.51]RAH83657.1 hypothetical protein BO86DRAFT_31185 [Aspergillus japonicus CBS 114.51]